MSVDFDIVRICDVYGVTVEEVLERAQQVIDGKAELVIRTEQCVLNMEKTQADFAEWCNALVNGIAN